MPGYWSSSSRHALAIYVSLVVLAGAAATLQSLYVLCLHPAGVQWYVLVALTLISGSAVLKIPGIPANFTISDTFTITAAVLFGPAAGTVAVALDCLIISYRLLRAGLPVHRVAFNATAPSLAMWSAAHILSALGWAVPFANVPSPPVRLVLLLVVFVASYFALNTGSIALAVALEKRLSPFAVWRAHFLGLWLTYFGGGATAGLVMLLKYTSTSSLALLAVLVPLPLVLYYAFKEAMGRLDDRLHHLADLNAVYFSTIEALAQSIDAKDPFTHGHIRRVQMYALRLARELGVTAEGELKAIEAAALLHDMGKVGVPEYILNKPAKLTAAEYEKVKLHAGLGANILSSIEFPYPVVPIVRHHHERWDGCGYPDGLKGTEIPLGARILAVADCFDALTSDRPYRPRLSEAAAVDLLMSERGRSYDPTVVDAFIRTYRDVAIHEATPVVTADTLDAIGRAFHAAPVSADLRSGTTYDNDVAMAFFDLGAALAAAVTVNEVGRTVWDCVRRVVPASSCVLYLSDAAGDTLKPAFAAGENAAVLSAVRMPIGRKLTGWVAANRSTMVNADALLDVGDLADALDPPLHSCLSSPLVAGDRTLGAITLYSTHTATFADHHGQLVEAVAARAGHALGRIASNAAR
jgi:putative nucleotidyltransferase with HDIG domain